MNGQDRPTCWIIAGPNGAGKTTFALKYLPEEGCRNFVNADLIAAGMSPLAPERERMSAGRLFLTEIQRHIQARHDFGFETTLAGRGYPGSRYRTTIPSKLGEPDRRLCVACGSDRLFAQ
jgi:predicted ABC-type ATPase